MVMIVDDEDRERIMETARRNIVAGREVEADLVKRLLQIPLPDRLTVWKRQADEREAERVRARAELHRSEQEILRAQQEAAAGPMEFSEIKQEILGAVIAEVRAGLRAEIETAIGELRAELTTQRAVDRGDVIDLPALPLRRRSDAA